MIQSFKTNVTQVSCDNVCVFLLEVGRDIGALLRRKIKTWGMWDVWWPCCSFYCFVMPCWRWVYTMNIIYIYIYIYIYTFKYMDVFFTIYAFTHVIDTDVYIYIFIFTMILCICTEYTYFFSLYSGSGIRWEALAQRASLGFWFRWIRRAGLTIWRYVRKQRRVMGGYILPFLKKRLVNM